MPEQTATSKPPTLGGSGRRRRSKRHAGESARLRSAALRPRAAHEAPREPQGAAGGGNNLLVVAALVVVGAHAVHAAHPQDVVAAVSHGHA
eukprot:7670061-Pyramimonas_sp.AAC.1